MHRAWLLLVCLLLLTPALVNPVWANTVLVQVVPQNFSSPKTVTFELRRVDIGMGNQPSLLTISVNGESTLDLPPKSSWTATIVGAEHWAPLQTLVVSLTGTSIAIPVWQTATITGSLRVERASEPPAELAARFESGGNPSNKDLPLTGSVACTVVAERFRCQVPAALIDLRLRSRGYISHYFWGTMLRAAEVRDLGALRLIRGASVVGKVVTTIRGAKLKPDIRLVPRVAAPALSETAKTATRTLTTTLNDRGAFQFEGVAPGAYTVIVTQTGFAAVRRMINVIENVEVAIVHPLVLMPPTRLSVDVSPPAHPDGSIWIVKLEERGESRTGEMNRTGVRTAGRAFEFHDVAEGDYAIVVASKDGQRWYEQPLHVAPDPPPISIDLPLVRISGQVRFGKEPLSGDVIFGGRFFPESLKFHSDREGKWTGYLPHPGAWRVEVSAHAPDVQYVAKDLMVRNPSGAEPVQVDIEIPQTFVAGIVVDEDRIPVRDATIAVRSDTLATRIPSEGGAFRIDGVAPGWIRLTAETRDRISAPTDLNLGDDPLENVVLVLRHRGKLAGKLVAAGNPVAGAQIWAYPASDATPAVRAVPTTASGEFTLDVPPGTQELALIVTAPGYAMRVMRASTADDPLIIDLQNSGGSLIIGFKGTRPRPMISTNGVRLFLPLLMTWARLNGQDQPSAALVLPNLQPGEYTICLPSQPSRTCAHADVRADFAVQVQLDSD